jgi:hypothetical protein
MATTNQLWKMFGCVNQSASEACDSLNQLENLVTRCESLVDAVTANNQGLQNSPTLGLLTPGANWALAAGASSSAYNFNGYVIIPASWSKAAGLQDPVIFNVPVGFRPPDDIFISTQTFTGAGFASPVILSLEAATGDLRIINGFAFPIGAVTSITISYAL